MGGRHLPAVSRHVTATFPFLSSECAVWQQTGHERRREQCEREEQNCEFAHQFHLKQFIPWHRSTAIPGLRFRPAVTPAIPDLLLLIYWISMLSVVAVAVKNLLNSLQQNLRSGFDHPVVNVGNLGADEA